MATTYVSRARRRRGAAVAVALLAIAGMITGARHAHRLVPPTATAASDGSVTTSSLAWPTDGAAAIAVDAGAIRAYGRADPAPIASLAKVMTALVVLQAHPLDLGDDGRTFVVTADDVVDTAARRAQGQSVVPIAAGERLTEQQALEAILLPSANNVAVIVARAVGGSTGAFVERMNQQARRLGMTRTRYTDPSGYDPGTVSTAADQVVLARAAMRVPAFARIVGTPTATLPVAGTVANTDDLLGRDGFVGIKTGSDDAAGGCFMFAVRFVRGTQPALLYGVVLGQRGGSYIAAGLRAGQRLAASATTAGTLT